jgi:hypothetical protein
MRCGINYEEDYNAKYRGERVLTGVPHPRHCGKVVEESGAVWCAYCHRRMCKDCGTKCKGADNDHTDRNPLRIGVQKR